MLKLLKKLFAWGKFRTNLGGEEIYPVRGLPRDPLTPEQVQELHRMFKPYFHDTTVWYDPEDNQLYLRGPDGLLRTETYSDIGAFTDETGSKYYDGGVYEGCGRNPYEYGLRLIGDL